MTNSTTLNVFLKVHPRIGKADNRGFYIASSVSGVWYLYDDGAVRYGVNCEGKNAFWPTEEEAFHFWELWQEEI